MAVGLSLNIGSFPASLTMHIGYHCYNGPALLRMAAEGLDEELVHRRYRCSQLHSLWT